MGLASQWKRPEPAVDDRSRGPARRFVFLRRRAWEVSWVKRETNETGSPEGRACAGVFTVTTRRSKTADEIASNPLGLLISDFSWSLVHDLDDFLRSRAVSNSAEARLLDART